MLILILVDFSFPRNQSYLSPIQTKLAVNTNNFNQMGKSNIVKSTKL